MSPDTISCGATIRCKRSILYYCLFYSLDLNEALRLSKNVEDRVRSQNQCMSANFSLYKDTIIFKSN
jgi:hypothetical protein